MPATATKLAKSTPGPWTVHGDNKTLIGCDDRKMMLAEVLWEHVCTEWGRPIEEAQANARLIAAAPQLLAALENLLAYANGYSEKLRRIGHGAEELGPDADSASVAGMARAAILAAKGGN